MNTIISMPFWKLVWAIIRLWLAFLVAMLTVAAALFGGLCLIGFGKMIGS